MIFLKHFCFQNDEEHRRCLERIHKIAQAKKMSDSAVVYIALDQFVDRTFKTDQVKLEEFHQSPLEKQLDQLHQEYLSPNLNRYGNWREALEEQGLMCPAAVEYSKAKGWKT